MESVPEVQVPAGWTIDKRQAVGIAVGLVCLGILVGFRLGAGSEPLVVDRPVERTVFVKQPCADCEEKAAAAGAEPHHAVPGDSSIPSD
jgi:hypothetical protein